MKIIACVIAALTGAMTIAAAHAGALTRIDTSGEKPPRRLLRNLPSMAAAGGFAATSGPVDVAFAGPNAFVVMGWGGDPSLRRGLTARCSIGPPTFNSLVE